MDGVKEVVINTSKSKWISSIVPGCDVCGENSHNTEACPEIEGYQNHEDVIKAVTLARQTLPSFVKVVEEDDSLNVVAVTEIKAKTLFGALAGPKIRKRPQQNMTFMVETVSDGKLYVDCTDENRVNWLALIPRAIPASKQEPNIMCFQLRSEIIFMSTRVIQKNESLAVGYGPGYARRIRERDHSRDHITYEGRWKCKACGTACSSPRALHSHKKNCSECRPGSDSSYTLEPAGDDSLMELAGYSLAGYAKKVKPGNGVGSRSHVNYSGRWNCKDCGEACSCARALHSHRRQFHPELVLQVGEPKSKQVKKMITPSKNTVVVVTDGKTFNTSTSTKKSITGQTSESKDYIEIFVEIDDFNVSKRLPLCYNKETSEENQCNICYLVCEDLIMLVQHMRESHEFICCQCCILFLTAEAREKHACTRSQTLPPVSENLVFEDGALSYACLTCMKKHLSMFEHQKHVVWHYQSYQCNLCKQKYLPSIEELEAHYEKCMKESCLELNETNYVCEKCERIFHTECGLYQHFFSCDLTQLDGRENVCMECHLILTSAESYKYHETIYHRHSFCCRDCKNVFQGKIQFETHICFVVKPSLLNSGNQDDTRVECPLCNQPFTGSNLITHTQSCINTGVVLSALTCTLCNDDVIYSSVSLYGKHIQSHSSNQPENRSQQSRDASKKYFCASCDIIFSKWNQFNEHSCRQSDGAAMFSRTKSNSSLCPKCGKIFKSQRNLTQHIRRHGVTPFSCKVCSKFYYSQSQLKLHYESTHTTKLRTTCPHCSKEFRNKYAMRRHITLYHSSTVVLHACPVCGKQFRQKYNMLVHMIAHNSQKSFSCKLCDQIFKYPYQLTKHESFHKRGRAYSCTLCERNYVMKYDLNKHMKLMHSGKVYVCEFCYEQCVYRHGFKRHVQKKHPREAHLVNDLDYIKSRFIPKSQAPLLSRLSKPNEITPSLSMVLVDSTEHQPVHQSGQQFTVQINEGEAILTPVEDQINPELSTHAGVIQTTDIIIETENQQPQLIYNQYQGAEVTSEEPGAASSNIIHTDTTDTIVRTTPNIETCEQVKITGNITETNDITEINNTNQDESGKTNLVLFNFLNSSQITPAMGHH